MCISALGVMALASGVGAVATIHGMEQQRKAANHAKDAQIKAETDAAQSANSRLAQRKRALAANSLVTDTASGMSSAGRETLGGG